MITFSFSDNKILLHYTPERQENWVDEAISRRPFITLKKTFTFWRELYIKNEKPENEDDEEFQEFDDFESSSFLFAVLNGEYFKVVKGILVNDFDIYIHNSIQLLSDYFVADSNVAIFKVIAKIYKGDIYVGGNAPDSLPFEDFEKLLKCFPSNYERKNLLKQEFHQYLEIILTMLEMLKKYISNI